MQKRLLLKAALGAALLLGTSLAAHAEDALAKIKAAGVMKVGTETAFAPFDFIDAGDHVGLNVDLFAEIGKELGVKIEWVTLPWDGVLPGLEAGKFDIVAVRPPLPRPVWNAIASPHQSPKHGCHSEEGR